VKAPANRMYGAGIEANAPLSARAAADLALEVPHLNVTQRNLRTRPSDVDECVEGL
jgi:hypothetical protein